MLNSLSSTWTSFWDIPYLQLVFTLAWILYLIHVICLVVLQKREPVATLCWVICLAAFPFVGYLIYFLLGPQKIERQKLRRDRARSGLDEIEGINLGTTRCTELAQVIQSTTGLPPTSATEVRLLIDGAATYGALLEAIASARNHVHVEYYIFEPDGIGTRVRDALVERARAGVQVRLLLDAVGSWQVKSDFLKPLLEAGGRVAWFHPTRILSFSRPWVNLRTHRKLVVIDGLVALTGGINITDEEDESVHPQAYRDLHLLLRGEVVSCLQKVFVEDWVYASGDSRGDFHGTNFRPSNAPETGTIAVQGVPSGPDSRWEAIHRLHVSAIHEAKTRVWLVTPYFVPGEAACMALTSAALGGLDVRLLVPKHSDSRLVTWAARSYFDELLAAGVKVYEYGPRMLHTKALLCDDALGILGSANYDHRSFRLNFELSLLIQDTGVVGELARLLEGEFTDATPVRNDRNRSFWRHRLPEAFARLFSPLL